MKHYRSGSSRSCLTVQQWMVNCCTQKPTHLLRVLVMVMLQKPASHKWRDGKKDMGLAKQLYQVNVLVLMTILLREGERIFP